MTGLRVCHLGKYYHPAPGGIESHVRTLAHAQAALGLSVQVYCANHQDGPTTFELDGPVEVSRFRRLASIAKFDVCPELVARLARIDADILHVHVPNPTMLLALIAARPNKPVVVTYHSDLIRQKVLGPLFRPIERIAYRRVDAILPTSPTYSQGSSFLRSYTDRLQVLPHGIDLEPYRAPSAFDRERARALRAQYAGDGPLWLCAGRHVYYKGFLNAIRALTRVRGRLLLVGDGPDQPLLRDEVRRLGLGDRVIFTGALSDSLGLVPFYLAADAFWFPSNARSEAFGLVQVEAMASGCPVINTQIPDSGVAWVSPHEETGLTVPVNDPEALAAAANRLITEPGLRDRLAAAAQARAVLEFDHRIMAKRSLAIYHHVLRELPVTRKAPRPALTASPLS